MSGNVAGNRCESSQKGTGQGEALEVRNAGAKSDMVKSDRESLASERLQGRERLVLLDYRLWLKYTRNDNNRTAHYGPVRWVV